MSDEDLCEKSLAASTAPADAGGPASMRLWAIADIHLPFKGNRDGWAKLKARREEYAPGQKRLIDGLILAGDGTLFLPVLISIVS